MPGKAVPGQKDKKDDNLTVERWCKPGALCWVEIYDSTNTVAIEYSQGIIDEINQEKKTVTVKYEPGSRGPNEVSVRSVLERAEEPQLNDDLVDIEPLNDAELLRCLEMRFKKDLIYCFCGPSLLSTNPYKGIKNEDQERDREMFKRYAMNGGKRISKPHIWNMAAIVFWNLTESRRDQAICISGESGAGKSFSTKLCLSFITQLFSDKVAKGEVTIEDKIMSCNPILESFGNSKTRRNNDSSRFGKYFLLYFDMQSKSIKGSKIENYLLEKSRVINQADQERNYHIFYAVLKHMTSEEQEKYLFCDPGEGKADMKQFPYLSKSNCYDVKEISDEEVYNSVCSSFVNLGFSSEERETIWRILSVVLNLSRVEIDTSIYEEGMVACGIVKSKYLDRVLTLLGLSEGEMKGALCYKKITADASQVITPTQCEGVKDALAKDLFNSLFNWMVIKLNVSLIPEESKKMPSVGLLDIFGFEDFVINSIEQLCINYTNEKLQKLYIFCVFTAEKKIFEEESLGEHSDKIVTRENTEVLRLFESTTAPFGLYQLIDSACNMSRDNEKAEASLISSIIKEHQSNQLMTLDKMKRHLFHIRHTAKKVVYSAEGFTEKNRDELPLNLYEALKKGDQMIYRVFRMKLPGESLDMSNEKNKKTLVAKFRVDMEGLMSKLEGSGCNFIRCLKPNEEKVRDVWNTELFLTQIKYMGILDSIKVRRDSYPNRRTYKDFYAKYQDLDAISQERGMSFLKLSSKNDVDWKKLAANVVKSIENKTPPNQVLFGKTKVFMNIVYTNRLEELLEDVQKNLRIGLNKITKAWQTLDFVLAWNRHRKTSLKVVKLAKTLLITWNSKIEYIKFKSTLRIVLKGQHGFRYLKYKRNLRLQAYSTNVIGRSFKIFKIRQTLINARKMLERLSGVIMKMKFRLFMIRIRINKSITDLIFEKAWADIQERMKLKGSETVQRIWRGHVNRLAKMEDVKKLNSARETIITTRAGRTMVRITRGFLVRSRLNRMNRAAFYIQGFLRTKMFVKYLQLVKESVKKVQRAMRKYLLRNQVIKHRMSVFFKKNKEFIQQIKNIEHDVIFKQGDSFYDLKNLENYTRVKFFEDSKDFREYIPKIASFIPANAGVDLNPKMRLFSLLLDFDCFTDTSDMYGRSWAVDYLNLLDQLNQKGSRLLHLDVGDSFTVAVDDDMRIHSWGLNDRGQLARQTQHAAAESFYPAVCKPLGHLVPRLVTCADEHTMMVDYCNDVYVWGSNNEGQFGLGHPREVRKIVHLKSLGHKVQCVASKGKRNYFVGENGLMYAWPNPVDPERIYEPSIVQVKDKLAKFAFVSCGRNFVMAISTTGVLFGSGWNNYGQLGLGDTEDRVTFTPVETLRRYGEKIGEISCGANHCIAKTNTDKIFTWGNGSKGQLATGMTKHASIPVFIKIGEASSLSKARSVQAGVFCSYLLTDNKKVYHAGLLSKSERMNLVFTQFPFEEKVFGGKLGPDFIPLRLYCRWSKSIAVTYLMIADFRRVNVTTGIREKIADQVHSKWEEVYNQVLPPFTESIYKNICPKYTRKINYNFESLKATYSHIKDHSERKEKSQLKTKSKVVGSNNKENGVRERSPEQAKPTAVRVTRNPYNMKDPSFDKSYENLSMMRQRLEKLLSINETMWTEDDKLLVSTLNKL